jgi:hypothetical protein
VKNIARLILFFSVCFVLFFLSSLTIRLLQAWIDAGRAVPAQSMALLPLCIRSAWEALPPGLYLSLLFSLSYTSRRNIPLPIAVFFLVILAGGFTLGTVLGITRFEGTGLSASEPETRRTLGQSGLILSRGDTVMVLLGDPSVPESSRAVSVPGRALIYQETPAGPDNAVLPLPPAPFRREPASFLNALGLDFSLAAKQLESRFREGLIPFAAYAGALIFLLTALRCVLDFSSWPLANLFLGALVFRGILAFEIFLDAREIQDFIASFAGRLVPPPLISPALFCGLGLLILLYALLVFLAQGRSRDD